MSAALTVSAADPDSSDPPTGEMLLTDDLGNAVRTPTDSVAVGLRPTSAIGLKHQTPRTHKGLKLTGEVLEKLEGLWADLPKFAFFPSAPPP